MKLAVMTYSFRELGEGTLSFAEYVQICEEIGLDGVEFSNVHIKELSNEDVVNVLSQTNLEPAVYIIATNFVQKDPQRFEDAVALALNEIERALTFGCTQVMVSTGSPSPGLGPVQGRALIVEGLRQCVARGNEVGVRVTTENHGAHAAFRGRLEHMEQFLREVPGLRLTFDDGNFLLAVDDPMHAFHQLADFIDHVHVKDFAVVRTEEKGQYPIAQQPGYAYKGVALGQGVVPTDQLIEALYRRGYDGYLSIEHSGAESGRQGVHLAAMRLRSLLTATQSDEASS